ncbi:hypothetical protein GR160_10870 [Flavobacterium sp. Sd200]|uniref:hypothetical protein n=1 Tax=Flavobacterium sp. Sd200 TaxID=2692211 RepID=UPI00136A80D2|nr:hypothetical protein [Flavobacterium sp. Sd200]MXN91729.1 hypothetical protein [Flavobacterium sp. Sd200]
MGQGYLLSEIERLAGIYYKDFPQEHEVPPPEILITGIREQSDIFKARFADAVFRLRKEKQVSLLIEKYHHALVLLLDDFLESRAKVTDVEGYTATYVILNGLLLFIENRFSAYLNQDTELAPRYISLSQKDWYERLQPLKEYFEHSPARVLFEFVSESLLRFINAKRHRHLPLRALLYRKELLSEIELLRTSEKITHHRNALHEVLVYMNYNSNGYLEFYSREVATGANEMSRLEDRAAFLERRYRKLERLYCNTSIGLHPDKENIKSMMRGWLQGQLEQILNKKTDIVMPYGKAHKGITLPSPPRAFPKILCTFSGNHLGILLRGADQAGLIRAPSLSAVFKAIIPFVSTPNAQDLSPDSVRSKSYLFDEKDREDTIIMLERLIEKIRHL